MSQLINICCSNELFARGVHKTPDGQNICDHCFEEMFEPRHYGPPPGNLSASQALFQPNIWPALIGMESLEERRLREAREAEERERKLREIEAMRGRKVSWREERVPADQIYL